MEEKSKINNLKKEDYLQMIVVGLRKYCTSWNYDWLEKLKEECTVKTFFKLFTKVTKTYFFEWESTYYNVEFLKDERVVVKKMWPRL